MYILTEDGKKYLKHGLPERRLAELVKEKGILKIKDAQKMEDFSVAVQWAKRKNLVVVAQGEIELLNEPKETEEEKALKELADGKEISEKMIILLLERKMIEKKRETLKKRAAKLAGQEITNLTSDLIKTGVWKKVKIKPYNVEAVGRKLSIGKYQPYNRFLNQVKRKLITLGFEEMRGPLIETEFWNFDALYQPQNHSARTWSDTYQLKEPKKGKLPPKKLYEKVAKSHESGTAGSTGWKYKWNPEKAAMLMPRAHGTCLSARTLASGPKIPGKYFAMARCFRPDVLDATHLIEFNQVEGIVVGEELTFRNLLGILKMFAIEIAGAEEVKFYADYYPFTEPSVQMSAKHTKLGWVEFGGAGIFREEMTRPLGVDVPVLAWGLGIDRLAMFKLGINDIRQLFSTDIKWLREEKVI